MAGKGGGAWKVAYADFVTAMMAFFLVMWITSQSKQVKQAIAHHFHAPFESTKPPQHKSGVHEPPPTIPPIKASLTKDPKDPQSARPRVLTIRESDQTHTATVVFFSEESAELDHENKQRLKLLVPWIRGKPQKIEIRGHASRRPLPPGSAYTDGWQLSYARCLATMRFLASQGIPFDHMRLSQAGEYEPYTTSVEPELQARNSRVEVYVLNVLARDFVGTRKERRQQFESH